jgi:hypothetical protein
VNTQFISTLLLTVVCISLTNCTKGTLDIDTAIEDAITKVIEESYIKGIHGNQDSNLVKSGFHKDFTMLVLQDNQIDKVNVDEWLIRLDKMKLENPDLWNAETEYKMGIDVTGYSAIAKLHVYKGDIHFSTDYMLLYKFEEGWKIVSKIFSIPE